MWFENGLKAQKLLAQGVWSLHAKLEFCSNNLFETDGPYALIRCKGTKKWGETDMN
jgi:hypothetical protein